MIGADDPPMCCSVPMGGEHAGDLRCERRPESPIAFDGGPSRCNCPTCERHAVVIEGVRLCGGCLSERMRVNKRSA